MAITRRDFIKAAGGFVSATALSPSLVSDAFAAGDKPLNILFLQTDQHCQSVMGCYGNSYVQTPNLDKLAAEGARFTDSLCVTPFCSPTRASFITGQWPHTHGVVRNVDGRKVKGLDDNVVATEQLLFDQGYRTFQMGKWHLGDIDDLRCYRRELDALSLDSFRQALKVLPDKEYHKPRAGETKIGGVAYTPEMLEIHNRWAEEENRAEQDLTVIGRSLLPPEYNYESWLADRCIDLLRKYREQNFMITWSVSPPHAPWMVPDPFYSMYDPDKIKLPDNWSEIPEAYKDSSAGHFSAEMGEKRIREMLRCYYGQVSMMDWCIGRILQGLKRHGLEENTLVVYTSDHGDMNGGHGMICKSLPGYYEEIVHTPLIIRYPGRIKPGRVVRTHAHSVDFMPTFLDYAGVKPPKECQGVSLRPLIEGRTKDDDRPGFCERGLGRENTGWSRMVRTKEWKYACFAGGRRELFNLAKDPGELTNLATEGSAAADLKAMHKRLVAQAEKSKDPALDQLARV